MHLPDTVLARKKAGGWPPSSGLGLEHAHSKTDRTLCLSIQLTETSLGAAMKQINSQLAKTLQKSLEIVKTISPNSCKLYYHQRKKCLLNW